ncbi:MAG: hypothetical protein IJA63_03315 [Akkermansia sp.]|nr:hypothetical protein [Akkermansia sp.]
MADVIIITILIVCALLALRSCLRKKAGKGNSCCGGGCGCNCSGCHKNHGDKE